MPSWRSDVHGKADIVEEIVRIIGVDQVPMTPFERGDAPRKPVLKPLQLRTRRAKRALAARGMVEAVTWSFISKPHAELFGGGQPELALANPIAADLSDMRPSLLPGLIAAAQANSDRGFADVALFEVGQIFRGRQTGRSIHGGRWRPPWFCFLRVWGALVRLNDCQRVRRQGRRLCRAGGCRRADRGATSGARWRELAASRPLRHHPDRAAECARPFRRAASAHAGSARRRRAVDRVRGDPRSRSPTPNSKPTRAKPVLELSAFQPVSRDFAFIVDRTVKAGDIVRAAQDVDQELDHERHGVRCL